MKRTSVKPRRLKKVLISPDFIEMFIVRDTEFHAEILEGIPPGAMFIELYYDSDKRAIVFVYHHEEWPITPEGAVLETISVALRELKCTRNSWFNGAKE